MISFLKEWIISVAAMVIFMTLIDLILPSNNFKKYAKFVTGLIVIVTILSPVFKLFDKNIDAAAVISDYTESMSNDSYKIDKDKINKSIEQQTIDVFKTNLKKSIEEEIFKESGKKYSVSNIDIVEDPSSVNYCNIKNITLRKSTDDSSIKPVEKIVIVKSTPNVTDAPKDEKVIKILESKYNIDPSSVKFVK